MSVTARRASAAPAVSGRATRTRAALLWLLGAAISAFTMRRYLEAFDEGLLMQGASRILDGQWPYGDFAWPYGPGQPLAVAGLSWLFEPSVAWWRVVRVAADATAALAVWGLVRRDAGERWALAGWLAAALTAAQPTSANPFPVALAIALCAVLAGARGRPVLAGGLVAVAVFWRPDVGAVAGLAVLAALAARRPSRSALLSAAATAAGLVVLLYLPFALAASPGRLGSELVGVSAGDGGFWRLPFPLLYDGPLRGWPPRALLEDLKDALNFSVPLLALLVALGAAIATAVRRRVAPELAGVLVLGAGCALYLVSRADDLHAQPLALCACAAAPLALHGRMRRPLAVALAAGFGALLLAGAANRASALLLPPELEPVHLAGVPGIRVPPAEAAALPALAARVQALVPPGEPIYVAPRRSDLVTLTDPLVHFLVRRPNVLSRDVSLQARPAEQERIVRTLARVRPRAIVRWTDPLSSRPEPNPRGRPSGSRALDLYLARAYQLDARFGRYDVLVPR